MHTSARQGPASFMLQLTPQQEAGAPPRQQPSPFTQFHWFLHLTWVLLLSLVRNRVCTSQKCSQEVSPRYKCTCCFLRAQKHAQLWGGRWSAAGWRHRSVNRSTPKPQRYILWSTALLHRAPPCQGPILPAPEQPRSCWEPVGTDGPQCLAALGPKPQVFFCCCCFV